MSVRIVRNDITKMQCDAIVNTANQYMMVGAGCEMAIYEAAGREELLAHRREHVGEVPEGEVFITPGFNLPARYIIHAVSPIFIDGNCGEEEKLRGCYQKSLQLAVDVGVKSIAFPLISTGSFGYPKEEGMRIALDEINAFLLTNEIDVTLVVFGEQATRLGEKLYPDLESYIDHHYVQEKMLEEYGDFSSDMRDVPIADMRRTASPVSQRPSFAQFNVKEVSAERHFDERNEGSLGRRIDHVLKDTFSRYLLYLIESKGMTNEEVYKRAIIDKKVFSKIKNNPNYHPQKITALCLCIGAKLNLDETKDLLARAGYALSPCDKTDIIFSYFIEKGIYDIIDLDIQLEEYGEKCLIS